jgi:hypothetical protein
MSVKSELDRLIAAVEGEKDRLEANLNSLRKARAALDDLSSDIWKERRFELTEPEFKDEAPKSSLDIDRLVKSAMRERTQFGQICRLLVVNKNEPFAVAAMADVIGAGKNAVANVLYRTQRQAFTSESASDHPRTRLWKLVPELYTKLTEHLK